MMQIFMIPGNPDHLERLKNGIENDPQTTVTSIETGARALERIAGATPDLVVVDENLPDMTGLDFGQALIRVNPMANCALVSSLPDEEFHEASEGMGILMQIPVDADETFGPRLLDRLRKIAGLSAPGAE